MAEIPCNNTTTLCMVACDDGLVLLVLLNAMMHALTLCHILFVFTYLKLSCVPVARKKALTKEKGLPPFDDLPEDIKESILKLARVAIELDIDDCTPSKYNVEREEGGERKRERGGGEGGEGEGGREGGRKREERERGRERERMREREKNGGTIATNSLSL